MATYRILQPGAQEPVEREPIPGVWYVGINRAGQSCLLAKWDGFQFTNSDDLGAGIDMTRYDHLKERT